MATLSTHVLDTALGRPAAGVAVTLTTPAGDRLGVRIYAQREDLFNAMHRV